MQWQSSVPLLTVIVGTVAVHVASAMYCRRRRTIRVHRLRNRYVAVRHGQSRANVLGIVNSRPGDPEYALTDLGWEQVSRTADRLDRHTLPASTRILIRHSPLKRAAETAAIIAQRLRIRPDVIASDDGLIERDFGDGEGAPCQTVYETVWERDRRSCSGDEHRGGGGVESTGSVLVRTIRFIRAMEEEHARSTIIIVSHGDTLNVLATAFAGVDPSRHRDGPCLATAEAIVLNDVKSDQYN
ncbi:Histidine phosphatase superfamily (branch 1) [Plasmodiophora brassicae]